LFFFLKKKDQNDLSIILGGALDKHCSTTQVMKYKIKNQNKF